MKSFILIEFHRISSSSVLLLNAITCNEKIKK